MADTKVEDNDITEREIAPGVKVPWSKSLNGPISEGQKRKVEDAAPAAPIDLSPYALLAAREITTGDAAPQVKHEEASALAVAEAAAQKDRQDEINAKRAATIAAKTENAVAENK